MEAVQANEALPPFVLQAPAKINVRLKVVGRRDDGYHLLSMLNLGLDLCDELRVQISAGAGIDLRVVSEDGIPVAIEGDNLVSRAAEVFLQETGVIAGLSAVLKKRIPIGAGLGGGSSDAAALLRLLAGYFGITDRRAIYDMAARVGSDVPFFAHGAQAAAVSGIGEEVVPLSLPFMSGRPCVLVVPGRGLATPRVFQAYRELHPHAPAAADAPLQEFRRKRESGVMDEDEAYRALLGLCENDLEGAAVRCAPEIGRILAALRRREDCVSGMTGSGSVVFVLPKCAYLHPKELRAAVERELQDEDCRVLPCAVLANSGE